MSFYSKCWRIVVRDNSRVCADDDCPCHQPAQERMEALNPQGEWEYDPNLKPLFPKQPPQEKNILTDITPERLKELEDGGAQITRIAPQGWEEEFDALLLDFGKRCVDGEGANAAAKTIKAFIARKIAEANSQGYGRGYSDAISEDEIEAARQAERERILALLPHPFGWETSGRDREAIAETPEEEMGFDVALKLVRKAIGEST